jgi:hypothetical protein
MKHRFFILVKCPDHQPEIFGDPLKSLASAKYHLEKIAMKLPNGSLAVIAKDVEKYEVDGTLVRCDG